MKFLIKKIALNIIFFTKFFLLKKFIKKTDSVICNCNIDVVYTWVDDSDEQWLEKKNEYLKEEKNEVYGSSNKNRYKNRNELLYSIRSVKKFAPWVNNIYLVTDDQVPDWISEHPDVIIVDHKDIFPSVDVLPVFNSHAIESCLHRIDGLSDKFLYFNDDVFLGCSCLPEDFFSKNLSKTKFYYSDYTFIPDVIDENSLPVDISAKNNINLLNEKLGIMSNRKFKHTPIALDKNILFKLEKEFPSIFDITRRNRFRAKSDYSIVSSFYHHYTYYFNLSESSDITYKYIALESPLAILKLKKMSLLPPKVFCLNDVSSETTLKDEFCTSLKSTLDIIYPVASSENK